MRFSFSARKTHIDCAMVLRRIVNQTTPNPATAQEFRSERRYNRVLPVMLGEFSKRCDPEKIVFALTKDISDRGVAIVINRDLSIQFSKPEIIFGIWPRHEDVTEPYVFRATLRGCYSMGAGYWQLGVSLDECLNVERPKIARNYFEVAEHLLPTSEVTS